MDSALTTFDLLLIGYGNVAQRFTGLLEEQRRRAKEAVARGIAVLVVPELREAHS